MITINFSLSYIEIYLIGINIIGFLVYAYDKLQAVRTNKNVSRVSEKALLSITFVGATIGAIVSMILFNHKIKKLSFMIKFIIVVLVQIIILYFEGGVYDSIINL